MEQDIPSALHQFGHPAAPGKTKMAVLASYLLAQELIYDPEDESIQRNDARLPPGTKYETVEKFEQEVAGLRVSCSIFHADGSIYMSFTGGLNKATAIPGQVF